jgi:hypothetical protein
MVGGPRASPVLVPVGGTGLVEQPTVGGQRRGDGTLFTTQPSHDRDTCGAQEQAKAVEGRLRAHRPRTVVRRALQAPQRERELPYGRSFPSSPLLMNRRSSTNFAVSQVSSRAAWSHHPYPSRPRPYRLLGRFRCVERWPVKGWCTQRYRTRRQSTRTGPRSRCFCRMCSRRRRQPSGSGPASKGQLQPSTR